MSNSNVIGLDALRGGGLRTALVDVPAWGGQVMLREMTGAQRALFLERVVDLYRIMSKGMAEASGAEMRVGFETSAEIVKMCWVDGEGNPVIRTPDDCDLLLRQPLDVVSEVAAAALKLSGLAPSATEEAKKNSTRTKKQGSGTA